MTDKTITELSEDGNNLVIKRNDSVAVDRSSGTFEAKIDGPLLLPDGGTVGRYLRKTAAGSEWAEVSIGAGDVGTTELAPNAVVGTKLAADSVGFSHLNLDSDGAQGDVLTRTASGMAFKTAAEITVGTGNITDKAVTTAKIADDAVGADQLAPGGVDSTAIAAGAVIHSKLGADCVDGDNISDNSIGSEHIKENAVGTSEIAADAIGDTQLKRKSIGWGTIDDRNIFAKHLKADNMADGRFIALKTSDHLNPQNDQVPAASGTGQLVLTAVDKPLPGDGDVTNAMIANSAVDTEEIANAAITRVKMADDAVGLGQIFTSNTGADGQILKRTATGLVWADDADSGAAGLDLARAVDADLASEFWADWSVGGEESAPASGKSGGGVAMGGGFGSSVEQNSTSPNEGSFTILWKGGTGFPSGITAEAGFYFAGSGTVRYFYALAADGTASFYKLSGGTWAALAAAEHHSNVRGMLPTGEVARPIAADALGRPGGSGFFNDSRPFIAKRVGDTIYAIAAKFDGTDIKFKLASRSYEVPAEDGTLVYHGTPSGDQIPVYNSTNSRWQLEAKPSGGGLTHEDIVRFSTPVSSGNAGTGQSSDNTDRTLPSGKSFGDYDFIIIERKERPGSTLVTAHSPMFLTALSNGVGNEIISFPNWSSTVVNGINIDIKSNTTYRFAFLGPQLRDGAGEGCSAIIGVKI